MFLNYFNKYNLNNLYFICLKLFKNSKRKLIHRTVITKIQIVTNSLEIRPNGHFSHISIVRYCFLYFSNDTEWTLRYFWHRAIKSKYVRWFWELPFVIFLCLSESASTKNGRHFQRFNNNEKTERTTLFNQNQSARCAKLGDMLWFVLYVRPPLSVGLTVDICGVKNSPKQFLAK